VSGERGGRAEVGGLLGFEGLRWRLVSVLGGSEAPRRGTQCKEVMVRDHSAQQVG